LLASGGWTDPPKRKLPESAAGADEARGNLHRSVMRVIQRMTIDLMHPNRSIDLGREKALL